MHIIIMRRSSIEIITITFDDRIEAKTFQDNSDFQWRPVLGLGNLVHTQQISNFRNFNQKTKTDHNDDCWAANIAQLGKTHEQICGIYFAPKLRQLFKTKYDFDFGNGYFVNDFRWSRIRSYMVFRRKNCKFLHIWWKLGAPVMDYIHWRAAANHFERDFTLPHPPGFLVPTLAQFIRACQQKQYTQAF